jgi:hypothetical protein
VLSSDNVILRQMKKEGKRDHWMSYRLKLYGLGLFKSHLLTSIFTDLRPGYKLATGGFYSEC